MVVTIDEVKAYLGIDYADDMITSNIERCIRTADAYIKGAVGSDYPIEDPRIKELTLIIISDLYDNRGLQSSMSGNMRRLVDDLALQVRLELRREGNEE